MLAVIGYRIEDPNEPDAADRDADRQWRRLTKAQRDYLLGLVDVIRDTKASA
jgi:hypothetical protein